MSLKNILSDTDNSSGKDNHFQSTILIGRVAEVVPDENGANVRVIFPDRLNHQKQPLITKPIPVLQISAGKKRSFALPRIGQNVLVARRPGANGDYFLLGSFYTTSDKAPVTDPNLDYTEYDDGSIIQFDAGSGTMTWDLKGGISLQCVGDVLVKSNGSLTLDAPSITLRGDSITLDGPVTTTADMVTTGHHTDAAGTHS